MSKILYPQMSQEQKQSFFNQLKEFCANTLPRLDAGLPRAELDPAFESGLALLESVPAARPFVRDARMVRDYKRYISGMRRFMDSTLNDVTADLGAAAAAAPSFTPHVGRPTREEAAARAAAAAAEAERKENEQTLFGRRADMGAPAPSAFISGAPENLPHLDQLAFLLSPALREDVARVRDIRAAAAEASTRAKQMAEDGRPEEEVAPLAKEATEKTEQYENIYAQVDNELAVVYVRLKEDKTFIDEIAKQGMKPDELRTILRPYWDKIGAEQDAFKAKVIADIDANDPAQAEARAKAAAQKEVIDKLTRYITRKDKDNTDTRIKGLEERMAQLRPLISEKEAAELDAIIAGCKADNARLNAAKQEEKEKKAADKKAAKEAAKADAKKESKKETEKADTKA